MHRGCSRTCQKALMERGFKSRCEHMARSLRGELGLDPTAALSPERLASYLNIHVWPVTALGLGPSDIEQLVHVDSNAWSAITVAAAGREAIITNPNHRGGRYSSDVMHELAHLLLRHQPSTMFFAGDADLALRGYNAAAEQEANWLAATLLLPRVALVQLQRLQVPLQAACEIYVVSERLLTFRMNVTGVTQQFARGNTPAKQN